MACYGVLFRLAFFLFSCLVLAGVGLILNAPPAWDGLRVGGFGEFSEKASFGYDVGCVYTRIGVKVGGLFSLGHWTRATYSFLPHLVFDSLFVLSLTQTKAKRRRLFFRHMIQLGSCAFLALVHVVYQCSIQGMFLILPGPYRKTTKMALVSYFAFGVARETGRKGSRQDREELEVGLPLFRLSVGVVTCSLPCCAGLLSSNPCFPWRKRKIPPWLCLRETERDMIPQSGAKS